jgi:hypothetical protein
MNLLQFILSLCIHGIYSIDPTTSEGSMFIEDTLNYFKNQKGLVLYKDDETFNRMLGCAIELFKIGELHLKNPE